MMSYFALILSLSWLTLWGKFGMLFFEAIVVLKRKGSILWRFWERRFLEIG